MSTKRRRNWGKLVAVVLSVVLMSCVLSTGQAAEKKILRHFCSTGSSRRALNQQAAALFTKIHPEYKIEFVGGPWGTLFEKFMTEVMVKKGEPDSVYVNSRWIPQAGPYMEDLTPYVLMDGPPLGEFAGIGAAWKYGDKIIGLPSRVMPEQVLYARRDLLNAAGLEIPQNWRDFMQAARVLTQDTDGDGQTDIWGTGLEAGGEPDTSLFFVAFVNSRGGKFITPDGKLYPLDSRHWRSVTETLRQWRTLYGDGLVPPGVINWDLVDNRDRFMAGKTAMMFTNASRAQIVEDKEKSQVVGKVAYEVMPHETDEWKTPIGGWAIGMFDYISEERKKDAWPWVRFVASYEAQLAMATKAANGPSRKDVLASEEFRKSVPAGVVEAILNSYEHGFISPVYLVAESPMLRRVMTEVIIAVLEGRKTPEDGTKEMYEGMKKILE